MLQNNNGPYVWTLQDQLIGEDKQKYKVTGGCTALVALFILGKLYIANAGDSRAVLCKNRCPVPLSNDFTPETERQRIRQLVSVPLQFIDTTLIRIKSVSRISW